MVSIPKRVHPYRRLNKQIFPVTVQCPRCKILEEIDAEFEDGRMVRIVPTKHFTWYDDKIFCHCKGNGATKVFLPYFLKLKSD